MWVKNVGNNNFTSFFQSTKAGEIPESFTQNPHKQSQKDVDTR